MAKIKLNGIVAKISGKFQGSIFATGKYGNYFKSNSYSQQPNSVKQSAQRNKIYQFSQIWRTLTQTQKDSYIAEIANYPYTNAVGEIQTYSGYQLFNFLNANRLLIGETILLNAPSFVGLTLPTFSINSITSSSMLIGWVGNAGVQTLVIYATRSLDATVLPKPKDYLKIGSLTMLGANATSNIISLYTSVFSSPGVNLTIHLKFKVVISSTGNTSPIYNQISKVVT